MSRETRSTRKADVTTPSRAELRPALPPIDLSITLNLTLLPPSLALYLFNACNTMPRDGKSTALHHAASRSPPAM